MADEQGLQNNGTDETGTTVGSKLLPPVLDRPEQGNVPSRSRPTDNDNDSDAPSKSTVKMGSDDLDSDEMYADEMSTDEIDPDDIWTDSEQDRAEIHDEIVSRLRADDLDLSTFESRQEFLQRYGQCLDVKQTHRGNTILHTVAQRREKMAPALTRLLVKEYPNLMEAQNDAGRTALHVALLTRNRHVVRAMAEALEGIDKILSIQDHDGRNCLHTAMRFKVSYRLVINLVQRASERTLCGQDRRGLTPLHEAVSYELCTASRLEIVRELLKRGESALTIIARPPWFSPYEYHIFTRKNFEAKTGIGKRPMKANLHRTDFNPQDAATGGLRPTTRENIRPTEQRMPDPESAEHVEEELRMGVLRTTKSVEEAKRILYGHMVDDVNLSFNFYHGPSIAASAFLEGYSRLLFYTCLFQVSLGDCRVENEGRQNKSSALGRTDAVFFFNWLRDKGVRRILRVIVKDLDYPPHTEEAIELALHAYRVEVLDWQRADICPETICNVGQDLVHVHLHWSGNNAALRAWSEPEGLPRLRNLKRISLTVLEYIEDYNRIRRNLGRFCQRMTALRPDIQVTIVNNKPTMSSTSPEEIFETAEAKIQRWYRCMNDFADCLNSLDSLPESDMTVKVALIDDGVNILDERVRGRHIFGGTDSYNSDTGHGTEMAALILSICPKAELWVFRLDTSKIDDGRRGILASSAARALNDAVAHAVDIICMPWVIDTAELRAQDEALLADRLRMARDRATILFCSQPDLGVTAVLGKQWYPAAAGEAVMVISGLIDDPRPRWVDDDHQGADFVFPGKSMTEFHSESDKPISGSSVATALATGLAATILYCTKLWETIATDDLPEKQVLWTDQDVKRLHTHRGMVEAFRAICGDSAQSRRELIPVWKLFGSREGVLGRHTTVEEAKEALLLLLSRVMPVR